MFNDNIFRERFGILCIAVKHQRLVLSDLIGLDYIRRDNRLPGCKTGSVGGQLHSPEFTGHGGAKITRDEHQAEQRFYLKIAIVFVAVAVF